MTEQQNPHFKHSVKVIFVTEYNDGTIEKHCASELAQLDIVKIYKCINMHEVHDLEASHEKAILQSIQDDKEL